MYRLISFKILILFHIFRHISSDCGFPAIPVHMKVKPLTGVYYEDDIVEYYCEYSDMNIIGNSSRRQCHQSRWKGDIPQCVREVPRSTLDRIELVDIKNHTLNTAYNYRNMYYDMTHMQDYERYQAMTYYGNYKQIPDECIYAKIKQNVPSLQWKVAFKWPIAQIYHVSIVVYKDKMNDRIDWLKSDSVISHVYVSDYRNCKSESVHKIDIEDKLIKYSFICELKSTERSSDSEAINGVRFEYLSNMTINFAVNEINVCELHVSVTLPFRSYESGSCGSPDVPLFASYSPVFDDPENGVIPIGYSYTCDEGFRLEGNPTVICGINNQWMDTFPVCLPLKSCDLMNKTKLNELSLTVDYTNLYSTDGNISAINGTQAIYSCVKAVKTADSSGNITMIGDSVSFCQINGTWSGEEPVCIEENDFTIYFSELNEDILSRDTKLPEFAHYQHQPYQCGIPAIPKYSKIYTYDENLINLYITQLKQRIDLLPSYPNGSAITYMCESKFTYMGSDFEARTCVNGSWIGHIGKCYSPLGGTDVSKLIAIQETTSGKYNNYYKQVFSNKTDQFWSFIETESGCISLDIEKGSEQTFTLYLSMPVSIAYFALRFAATNIFHELEEDQLRLDRASDLDQEPPITADIYGYSYYENKIVCELTKVIQTGASFNAYNGLTQVSFKCDGSDSDKKDEGVNGQNRYLMMGRTSAINIHVKPDLFHENFNSTNITLCGLMLFKAPEDCGLPESIPNSEVDSFESSGYVRYKCKPGYKLVGNEYVRCSKLGKWLDKFPRCELYKLCELNKTDSSSPLKRQYFNTMLISGEEVAVLGTIAEYKCKSESITAGKHIIIGPRTAVCTSSGKWNVEEPFCEDDTNTVHIKIRPGTIEESHLVVQLVIFIAVTLTLVLVLIAILYRRYGCSNPLTTCLSRRKPARRSSTFISYGQSLRDSVLSFNGPGSITASNNNISANLIKI